jgi:uncharacterized protein YbjT (DUF2867 family)
MSTQQSTQAEKKPLVVVTGVTGKQGCSVAQALLKTNKFRIRGIVRNPSSTRAEGCKREGIELVQADLMDKDSLKKALQGADYAYLVTQFWEAMTEEHEIKEGKNFIDACREVGGIKHIVFSSLPSAVTISGGKLKVGHFDSKATVEHYLRSFADLSSTIVYFSSYYENFLAYYKPEKINGVYTLQFPLGDAKLGSISVLDGGVVVGKIFENPNQFSGKSITMCCELLTGAEYAERLTRALGVKIEYHPKTIDDYEKQSFPGAHDMAQMFRFYEGYGEKIWNMDAKKIHPNMQSFEAWATAHKDDFKLH